MIHLQLVTLSGMKFDDDVYEVILPTRDGEIGVLTDHMPLMSVATNGVISIRRHPQDPDRARELFAISGGAIEVVNNTLKVIVDEADHEDEINEEQAQKAFAQAQKMRAEAKDQVSLEHAQQLMDRTAVRLHVAQLRRRHGPRHRS